MASPKVKGICICGPAEDTKQQLLKSKKGIFGVPGAKLMNTTSYTTTFLAPPKNLYTGISVNLGLKERVEGAPATLDPSKLGLGREGGTTSYHLALPVHARERYTDRVRPDPAAKKAKLKMDKGHAGYVTSYSAWGRLAFSPCPSPTTYLHARATPPSTHHPPRVHLCACADSLLLVFVPHTARMRSSASLPRQTRSRGRSRRLSERLGTGWPERQCIIAASSLPRASQDTLCETPPYSRLVGSRASRPPAADSC